MTARMTSATEGVVTVKALIEPGWHLYGLQLPEGAGPKPTVMEFGCPKGFAWAGALTQSAAPTEKADALFGVTLRWWEQDVTFTRRFTVENPAEPGSIEFKVTFMGCNDVTCLPPSSISISRKIKPFK